MNKFLAAASAFALLSGTAHAADNAAQPSVFKPAGPWQADFGDDYCRLARPFTDGKVQLSLAMDRIQPTSMARMVIVGNAIKLFRSSNQLDYSLLPANDSRKGPFWRSETPDGQQFISLGDVLLTAPVKFTPGQAFRPMTAMPSWNSPRASTGSRSPAGLPLRSGSRPAACARRST